MGCSMSYETRSTAAQTFSENLAWDLLTAYWGANRPTVNVDESPREKLRRIVCEKGLPIHPDLQGEPAPEHAETVSILRRAKMSESMHQVVHETIGQAHPELMKSLSPMQVQQLVQAVMALIPVIGQIVAIFGKPNQQ